MYSIHSSWGEAAMAASPTGSEGFLKGLAGSKTTMDRGASQHDGGAGASRVEVTVAFAAPSDGNERSKGVLEVEEEVIGI